MERAALSKREVQVLQALVKAYVALGDPIGSTTLVRREGLDASSATIRSALALLEEKGYVQQPHTSAGRVPTDRAYRFYVEYCLGADHLLACSGDDDLRTLIEAKLQEGNVDAILGQLARVVGDISSQLGLVLAPSFELGVLQQIELIRLTRRRLLLVATIDEGLVRSLEIEVNSRVSRRDIQTVSRLLNERLSGLTIAEIRRSARHRLHPIAFGNPQLLRVVTDEIEELSQPTSADLHVAGAANICRQPEFRDPGRVASLIELVENKSLLAGLMQGRQGVVITIGEENSPLEMRICSMVTASYEVNGMPGVLGVLGPTRMRYDRVMSLVNYAALRAADLVI